ncbi:hypothetical protein [Microbacterium mitrae]|uniref:hypothetical protein n=1 Tax=Microbacterium mitrae TaxID=664640 RepID=UPI00164F2D73|nr:hypothetical protein [Microbacterium mitrae]
MMPPTDETFHDELIHTSRGALLLFLEELVDLFISRRGERGHDARRSALSVLAGSIVD